MCAAILSPLDWNGGFATEWESSEPLQKHYNGTRYWDVINARIWIYIGYSHPHSNRQYNMQCNALQ